MVIPVSVDLYTPNQRNWSVARSRNHSQNTVLDLFVENLEGSNQGLCAVGDLVVVRFNDLLHLHLLVVIVVLRHHATLNSVLLAVLDSRQGSEEGAAGSGIILHARSTHFSHDTGAADTDVRSEEDNNATVVRYVVSEGFESRETRERDSGKTTQRKSVTVVVLQLVHETVDFIGTRGHAEKGALLGESPFLEGIEHTLRHRLSAHSVRVVLL
mmetsp:Transcript_491/g.887  ORF Transcript_491/g.887 Transcript_491/m.887 type:complete len:213 (+) Transcript_491:339-977(+)